MVDEVPGEMPGIDEQPAAGGPPLRPDGADQTALELPTDEATATAAALEVPTSADALAIERLVDEILPLLIARFRPAGWASSRSVARAGTCASGGRSMSWPRWPAAPPRGPPRPAAEAGRPAPGRRRPEGMPRPVAAPDHRRAWPRSGPGRPLDGHGAASATATSSIVATSPGVGYFTTRDGIATGSQVRGGDVLGHVDVLGVRQEVVAPGDGIVARLMAEAGEAVEYGQDLVRLEPVTRADLVREA